MPAVFAIFAHPDDIEFVAAGTLLRLREQGYELHYLNVANGCCGSTEYSRAQLAQLREAESRAACQWIGAHYHPSLTDDLAIFYDGPTLARLAAIVREVAPEIVLTHSPADYMEDHMNCCRLALTATFARGMPNFPVAPRTKPVEGPVAVYHAQPHGNRDPLGNVVRPSQFVDVTAVMSDKTAMLACHASQCRWLDSSQGLNSYLQAMHDLMREVGAMSERFAFAEGWRRHLHLGYGPEDFDPLAAVAG